MVPNTSDDLPDPETPVNTVSRRLGISTLTSFRLFTRAPWTRIRSWLSAACWREAVMFAILSAIWTVHEEVRAGVAAAHEVVDARLHVADMGAAGEHGRRQPVGDHPAGREPRSAHGSLASRSTSLLPISFQP